MLLALYLNQNRFIVVCSDYLTRWPEAFAVPDTTAPTIARLFVENIVCHHGAPRVLLSDQGTNFLSKLVSEICQIVGIKQIKTSSYYAETDGLVERQQNPSYHDFNVCK